MIYEETDLTTATGIHFLIFILYWTQLINNVVLVSGVQRSDSVLYLCAKLLQSCLTLCDTWTVAHQVSLSTGFSRKKHWTGLPGPSPGDLPDPGIEHMSLTSPALAGEFLTASTTWEAHL